MNPFKTLQVAALITAALVSNVAGATGYEYSAETPCDLRIEPKVLTYTDSIFVKRLKFDDDQTFKDERSAREIAPGDVVGSEVKQAPERACREYIRKHFTTDILYDNGPVLIAQHYYCTPTGAYTEARGWGNEHYIYYSDVRYGKVVMEQLTTDQVVQLKCERLNSCLLKSDGRDLEWISKRMATLGCAL